MDNDQSPPCLQRVYCFVQCFCCSDTFRFIFTQMTACSQAGNFIFLSVLISKKRHAPKVRIFTLECMHRGYTLIYRYSSSVTASRTHLIHTKRRVYSPVLVCTPRSCFHWKSIERVRHRNVFLAKKKMVVLLLRCILPLQDYSSIAQCFGTNISQSMCVRKPHNQHNKYIFCPTSVRSLLR